MIEKILERLEDYKYTHLVERDKERLEHCTENDRAEHCEGIDCFWCVWDKAIKIVQEVAKEYCKDTNVRSNADRIRSMSDEELAEYLETLTMICSTCIYLNDDCAPISNEKCRDGILSWLKSKVKE